MKKNQLTTTKNTNLILGKSKSLMALTKKILEPKTTVLIKPKESQDLSTHEDITIIGDLMWEKKSKYMNWNNAISYAINLKLGGYDDWRLPTIDELEKIITDCGGVFGTDGDYDYWKNIEERNKRNKAYQSCYKLKGFAGGIYWSFDIEIGVEDSAGIVRFNTCYSGWGGTIPSYAVRCVRSV